jgi:cytochrome P450
VPRSIPTELGFRPGDPTFIADPYPVFGALRGAGRALAYPERDSWLLPRFADVHAALRHRGLGRIFTHRYSADEFGRTEAGGGYPRWQESERWSLLNLEPPDHTRIRRLVTAVFTPRAVDRLRPEVERISAELLAGLSGRSTFDLIGDYAQPYSIAVICLLLGVPLDRSAQLLEWSHAIVKMYELSNTETERQRAETAGGEFIDYVRTLIAARRADPGEDLVSGLVEVADSGERLTDDEIVCTVIVLLNAGHEATVNTLGNGMRAALKHPGQWARVTGGEVSPRAAVEELIRWDAPLQLFERWVLEDEVELAGRTFRRGERIGMLFGVANRDPDRFADPDAFDIGRGDTGHIGFGGGTHFCIGAPLARLELETSLAQLAAGPPFELAAEPAYQPYFVIRGLAGLPLRWSA